MPTLFSDARSMAGALAAGPASRGHESDYGQPPAVQWRQWSNWPARQRQREALRALADDKHLRSDLGLTREQALEEAARPFWG